MVTLPAESGSQPVPSDASEKRWEGQTLFQASGWIEPDPFPIRATALVDGIVDEVFVLEGQSVREGEILATLINDNARFELEAAEARLRGARHEQGIARFRVKAAENTMEVRKAAIESAQARLAELQDDAERLQRIGSEAVSEGEILRSALRVDAQKAVLDSRKAELEEWESQLLALRSQEELAKERLREAEVALNVAQLAFDRTKIASPVDGVIQRLMVAPGRKRMVGMDDPESATVAILFQPESLQARIDVPLEQASALFVGQPVYIRSNFLPEERFRGEVTRIVGEADLQRNTLQAKVALLETDSRLRPEMLCRAEFLGGGSEGSGTGLVGASSGPGLRLYIPSATLDGGGGDEAAVWIVSPNATVRRNTIRIGETRRDGFVEVLEGVRPGQQLVLNPEPDLVEGERVKMTEEL